MHIEIAGNIASGKTTLAKLIGETDQFVPCLEKFQTNPFWQAFYDAPERHAFETEITFALQHYHDLQASQIRYSESRVTICDFALPLDMAYANVTLSSADQEVFKAVANRIEEKITSKRVLVSLRCAEDELLQRIRSRGRHAERNIEIDYLLKLTAAIEDQVEVSRANTEIIEIDSQQLDFANDLDAQTYLREIIVNLSM